MTFSDDEVATLLKCVALRTLTLRATHYQTNSQEALDHIQKEVDRMDIVRLKLLRMKGTG